MNNGVRVAVVDATVAARWIFTDETEQTDNRGALNLKADIAKGKIAVLAPKLLLLELMNLLSVGVRTNRISKKDAGLALEHILDIGILYIDESVFLSNSFHISLKTKLSLYDCVYLALASLVNGPLYTADRNLIDGAKDSYKGVLSSLIGDISTYSR